MMDRALRAEFLTPLRVEKVGSRRWRLTDCLRFRSARWAGEFCVQPGFETDFASIPRLLWLAFPPIDTWDAAAVLHDAAYAHALTTADGRRQRLTKQIADGLFEEALVALGVGRLSRAFIVGAVRRYGDPDRYPYA